MRLAAVQPSSTPTTEGVQTEEFCAAHRELHVAVQMMVLNPDVARSGEPGSRSDDNAAAHVPLTMRNVTTRVSHQSTRQRDGWPAGRRVWRGLTPSW